MNWIADFHFIRPLWLLTLIPLLAALWLARTRSTSAGNWSQVIDPQLLPYLLESSGEQQQKPSRLWRTLMLLAAVAMSLALAGPSWQKMPQPVAKNQDALIIMLDMSASMGAQDIKPSRYVRATQKITDIVRSRRDGQTALLVYAGDAHTVTPLTDDGATLENLLPALSPFIMPSPGSRPDKAIALAQQLAADAGVQQASLLLITDGIQDKDIARISEVLDRTRSRLAVMTIGSADGAPVPMPGSGFLRDNDGTIVLPKLDTAPVKALSAALGVPWHSMTLDDSDWNTLLSEEAHATLQTADDQNRFDLWADEGYWLIFLLLPAALLLFRRGVVLSLLLVPFLLPGKSEALEWQDLWQTRDQQGQALFSANPKEAAATFTDPAWAGSAAYRAGDYDAAAQAFTRAPANAQNLYNLGNALAMKGQLDEAEQAYEKALEQQPDFPEASDNLEKVRKARQQTEQQNQNQQDQNQQNQQGQNQQGQNQQGQNQQGQNQQGQNQQGQNQQDQNQQGQNQQGQNQQGQNQQGQNQQSQDQQNADQDAQANAGEEKSADEKDAPQSLLPDGGQSDKEADDNAPSAAQAVNGLSREEQEAMQQWLNRVPDQPGNLLQRKFLYQYRQNNEQTDQNNGEVLW